MAGLYLSRARHTVALMRMRSLIDNGEPLVAWDDTTPGAKQTHCSWGLCSIDAKAWPEPEDHLWPDQFRSHGRVATKYLKHPCPMSKTGKTTGCFFDCSVFKAPKGKRPTREEAIARYDAAIAKAQQGADT